MAAEPSESLDIQPYPSKGPWIKVTDKTNATTALTEWIPADQTTSDIHDILIRQAFFGMRETPAKFLRRMYAAAKDTCRGAILNGPREETEGGYQVARGEIYCVGDTERNLDIDIFVKVIGGRDALYVVQREFREPAEPGAVAGKKLFDDGPDVKDRMLQFLNSRQEAVTFLAKGVSLHPLPDTSPR
ncbi:MAG TPA: hypothetical protein VEL28_04645 [Candidatus Binatia bacterium]|nr:hypothetical protein [Candidatus Binatia bacterium]